MKYIKSFENNTDKYVIVTDGKHGLAINVNDKKSTMSAFRYIDDVENLPIKLYTLEETESEIPNIDREYNNMFTFRIMNLEEFKLLKNTNKFNL